ncbi:MAG: hypothetical protein ACLQHK_13285 [Gallionellaceae bacterium]
MNTAELIERASAEGVILALSPAGTIKATGNQSAIEKWLPTIRDNKPSILCELQRGCRRAKVLGMLEAAPGTRYAVLVADASTDPVVVAVGIREIATFELEIPHRYFDGMVLLELIEKQSGGDMRR